MELERRWFLVRLPAPELAGRGRLGVRGERQNAAHETVQRERTRHSSDVSVQTFVLSALPIEYDDSPKVIELGLELQ